MGRICSQAISHWVDAWSNDLGPTSGLRSSAGQKWDVQTSWRYEPEMDVMKKQAGLEQWWTGTSGISALNVRSDSAYSVVKSEVNVTEDGPKTLNH